MLTLSNKHHRGVEQPGVQGRSKAGFAAYNGSRSGDPPRGGSPDEQATVFVVDDDLGVRTILTELLAQAGLQSEAYGTGEEFLDAYDASRPGCIILDVGLPGIDGLEVQDRLMSLDMQIPIIMITGFGNVQMAVRAMRLGAVDFVQKPPQFDALLESVHQAIEMDRHEREQRSQRASVHAKIRCLTSRQREVLALVTAGLRNKESASRLGISIKTVEIHRGNVMRKMGAHSLAELVHLSLVGRTPSRRVAERGA